MSYYEDAISQLDQILKFYNSDKIKLIYRKEIEKIFFSIYSINYLSNRIELRRYFASDYFYVAFSCLLESLSLILNNHPRAASLVLRSSLENFLKFTIEICNTIHDRNFKINNKLYTSNKKTLDHIIDSYYKDAFCRNLTSLNSRMETQYSSLSALSHSLVPESKNNTLKYFSDIINTVSEEYLDVVFERMKVLTNIFSNLCILLCHKSLKEWETSELKKLLRLSFGKRKTTTILRLLKNNS